MPPLVSVPNFSQLLGSAGAFVDNHWLATVSGFYEDQLDASPAYLTVSNNINVQNFSNSLRKVAVDDVGNVYSVGYASSSLGLGEGDAYLSKFNNAGELVWQKLLGFKTEDVGFALALDESFNIYVVVANLGGTAVPDSANQGVALLKFTRDGGLIWSRHRSYSGAVSYYSINVAVRGSQIVVLVSSMTSASTPYTYLTTFDPTGVVTRERRVNLNGHSVPLVIDSTGAIYFALNQISMNNSYLYKVSPAGAGVWMKTQTHFVYDLMVDSSDNLYLAGSASAADGRVVKYSAAGSILAQSAFDSTALDFLYGLSQDASGNIYVVGMSSTAYWSTSKGVLIRYDSNLNATWVRTLAHTPGGLLLYGVRVGADNNLYAVGVKVDSVGRSVASLWAVESSMFLAKLPRDGSKTGTYGSLSYQTGNTGQLTRSVPTTPTSSTPSFSTAILSTALATAPTLIDLPEAEGALEGSRIELNRVSFAAGGSEAQLSFDSQGNLIAVGLMSDSVQSGSGVFKFDPSGALLWQKFFKGNPAQSTSYTPQLRGVFVDALDGIYVCGSNTQTQVNNIYGQLVVSLTSAGVVKWQQELSSFSTKDSTLAKFVAARGTNEASGIYVQVQGNLRSAMAGGSVTPSRCFVSRLMRFDGTTSTQSVAGQGSYQSGTLYPIGVGFDSSGSLYQGFCDVATNAQTLVNKLNSSGVQTASVRYAGLQGTSMVVSESGEIYLAGDYATAAGYAADTTKVQIVKLDSNLNEVWNISLAAPQASLVMRGLTLDRAAPSSFLYAMTSLEILKIDASNGTILGAKKLPIRGNSLAARGSKLAFTTGVSIVLIPTSSVAAPSSCTLVANTVTSRGTATLGSVTVNRETTTAYALAAVPVVAVAVELRNIPLGVEITKVVI